MTPRPAAGGSPATGFWTRGRLLGGLWLAAWLVGLLVQVPGMANVDSARRLQATRSFWTAEPPVREGEYPGFGLPGRDGVIHTWYGPGQSLVMLPADFVAAALERFVGSPAARLQVRSAVVATLTFPALNATTVLLVYLWLGQLGFRPRTSLAGAMSFLLGSSFLHFAQVHMENSLLSFLLFADAVCLGCWVASGRRRWLAAAAGCVALAVLVRLPSLAEHLGPWLAALWLLQRPAAGGTPGERLRRLRLPQLFLVALPVVALGLLADRWHHFQRFGTWTGTYVGLFAVEWRKLHPDLPAAFPFAGDFREGFLGPFLSPDRSMLLLDPLFWLLPVAGVAGWRKIPAEVRTWLVCAVPGTLLLVAFYAKCDFWDGAASWGNRYTLPAFQLLLALAVPVWLTVFQDARRWPRVVLGAVVGLACFIQVLSLLLPSAVERGQQFASGRRGFAVTLRLQNVAAKLAGRPPPPGVPEALWRINLAPATLGQGSPARQAVLWTGWLLGAGLAGWGMRRLWRASGEAPTTAHGLEAGTT